MSRFETSSNPPLATQGGGGTPPDGQNFHEQIQGMIEKGYSLKQIHSAIDGHPDMHSKDHFKEYAGLIHKPYTAHIRAIISNKGQGDGDKDNKDVEANS